MELAGKRNLLGDDSCRYMPHSAMTASASAPGGTQRGQVGVGVRQVNRTLGQPVFEH